MHPDANIDETRYFAWSISVLADDGFLLSDFLISNDVLGGTLWVRLNMEFSKSALYLQMNIEATRKNVTNDFRMIFRYVFVHAKTTLSMECQKKYHQGGF